MVNNAMTARTYCLCGVFQLEVTIVSMVCVAIVLCILVVYCWNRNKTSVDLLAF